MEDRTLLVPETDSKGGFRVRTRCSALPYGMSFRMAYLRMVVPEDERLVSFVDDLAIVAVGDTIELLEQVVNPVWGP